MELSKIKSKKKIDYKGKVYDLSFVRDHHFYAGTEQTKKNGFILVHNSSPDIDIDFTSDTDHITNTFLLQKYGPERVLPVCTFLTFNEKGCLKDVARAHYGSSETGRESDVFQVTKEMPEVFEQAEVTLEEWFKYWPEPESEIAKKVKLHLINSSSAADRHKPKECTPSVKRWLQDPKNKKILEQTLKLQGQIKGLGQHAAGIVITPTKSWDDIPTNMITEQGTVTTAFQEADKSGKDLSLLGILKLDRLKLGTINVIMDAIQLIKESHGVEVMDTVMDTVMNIDEHLEDKNLYEEVRLGLNHGVFQFESAGMNALLRNMHVETFDELAAANALFRPGPMGIGAHTEFIHNKFNPEDIKYIHPKLKDILHETNGVLVFQEQVQFLAKEIGGMSLGEGDILRRYMEKASKIIAKVSKGDELDAKEKTDKDYLNYKKYWNKLIEGAKTTGLSQQQVDQLESYLVKYLGYSFCKSHAVAYAYIAMQTLYLKHYYPTEFYTALLNNPKSSSGGKEKQEEWLTTAIASAIMKGISVKPPSRKSGWKCSKTGPKEISIGFSMVNGMGDIAYQELMDVLDKKQKKLSEITMSAFFSLPFSKFNKSAFEACLKAGVFDEWSTSREYLLHLKAKKKVKKDPNQSLLFDIDEISVGSKVDSLKFNTTTEEEKLLQFKEVCGFDIKNIERISSIKTQIDSKSRSKKVIVEPITNFTKDGNYYFFLDDIRKLIAKNDKEYLELIVGDGITRMKLRVFDPLAGKMLPELEKGAVYLAQFHMNDKNFLNLKKNAKFKKIAHSGSLHLIQS